MLRRLIFRKAGSVKTMMDGSGRIPSYGYDHRARFIFVVDGTTEIAATTILREKSEGDPPPERGEDEL